MITIVFVATASRSHTLQITVRRFRLQLKGQLCSSLCRLSCLHTAHSTWTFHCNSRQPIKSVFIVQEVDLVIWFENCLVSNTFFRHVVTSSFRSMLPKITSRMTPSNAANEPERLLLLRSQLETAVQLIILIYRALFLSPEDLHTHAFPSSTFTTTGFRHMRVSTIRMGA